MQEPGTMRANVVFDLDGTLIDSAPDIHGIANRLLLERGVEPIDLATARGFIGQGAPAFVAQLRQARGIAESEQPRLLEEFLESYETAVTLTRPYPGVEEALALLAETSELGICTNKPHRPCLAVLRHLELDRFFAIVLGGDSLPERKPHPRPLLASFEQMGPGQRIYVGDSEIDAETARRAAVPFVLFTEGYRKSPVEDLPHDARFSDFSELPEIVREVLGREAG
jgi:phosphoglycolate phosphatase